LVAVPIRGAAGIWTRTAARERLALRTRLRVSQDTQVDLVAQLEAMEAGAQFAISHVTPRGLRGTHSSISQQAGQVGGEMVTGSITGHVTPAMTEHDSPVRRDEKLAAAG
jgi:hypothetical protein